MGILFGFAPWIVYWLLVGNVPFHTAVLVALVTALAAFAVGRLTGSPGRTLETGSAVAFVVLTVLTFTASEDFMHEWIQSLSSLLVFLVALGSVLAGRSSGSTRWPRCRRTSPRPSCSRPSPRG